MAKLATAIVLGVVMVGTWIRTLLQCHAIYRLTDFMAAIILGYTFSCLILFGSADAAFFVSSVNYYLVLLTGVILLTLWYFSLLAVCGVIIMNIMVGATFTVLTLLFIFDGNLQYAFVNNWRRIRDDDFRYAFCFTHLEVVGKIRYLGFIMYGWVVAINLSNSFQIGYPLSCGLSSSDLVCASSGNASVLGIRAATMSLESFGTRSSSR